MELHLVGGFLGSGKTTAILEAARLLVYQVQFAHAGCGQYNIRCVT